MQTGLTGLGLGQLGGPVNGVLGTASGLESSVQGTLNGLGLGAVNGVAKSVLGTVNGLEDSVQGTVKGLGLPEPLGSTVGNVITTAKGVQGQALSQLNVVTPNPGTSDGSNQSQPDIQNQLDGLGLSGFTGLAGGALAPINGVQGQLEGQLSGLGLGALSGALPNAGSTLPKLDPSILSNILSTPNGIAALNNLSPAQLSSLGLGSITNAVSSPLSAVDGIQNQLQGLGLDGATGAIAGLAGNTPLSGLTNGAGNNPASALPLPQAPLAALSDPQAVQKLLLSQAQQIAQLQKLVLNQNQRFATSAARAGAPVGWPNPPVDQVEAAITNNALGDTAQVFGGGLYNNKLAVPQSTPEGAPAESNSDTGGTSNIPLSATEATPSAAVPFSKAESDDPENKYSTQSTTEVAASLAESSTAVPVSVNQATAVPASSSAPAAIVTPAPMSDAQVKVFAKLNPSKTESWYQTTSGWPWPMDAEHLPPPIPAFTSWGVKMAEANASARGSDLEKVSGASDMSAIPPPATAYASWGVKTIAYREDGARDSRNTEIAYMAVPEATPTASASGSRDEENNRMEKRSKTGEPDDGAENQSGIALNPMVPDVSSYLHDYVSSYQAPDSPGSFHSANSSPSTPIPNDADKSVPSVSGGAEGPQVVLGDSKAPLGTANKRSHGVPHIQEPQDPDDNLEDDPSFASVAKRQDQEGSANSQTRTMRKRQDDEEEHEDDPAEDNSENMPPKPEPTPEPEEDEDPVTISPSPELPAPLPKTLPAQPALHSKAHRVHKKNDNREHSDDADHHHKSMAFASPGGRPAMRRQQAYSPDKHLEHKHDGDKNSHVHIHYNGHSREHHHKRDEGHGDEMPDLPAASLADPMSSSQGKDPKQSAEYVGQHAQMSPDCWEAMAAGKHMEHAQKRPAKLKRRNAMPDLANAASGQSNATTSKHLVRRILKSLFSR